MSQTNTYAETKTCN